jgi:rhamnosyltransferase
VNSADVLAVVVSYNGLHQTQLTVDALRGQVGHVVVVDNGSGPESQLVLRSLERDPGITVERLEANRGVGHALNVGVCRARAMGYTWLLTMDQDSVVDGALIRAYQAAVRRNPDRVCLAPRIAGNGAQRHARNGVIRYAITSGNLVRVSLFDTIGPYDEGFFIDCIDFDFSLRVRRAGHALYRVADAVMSHQLGEAAAVPRFLRGYYALHSPTRRYYMYRNFLYMVERYAREFPAFIAKLTLAQVLLTILIGFLDPHPLESYRAIIRGVRDYVARRSGPDVEPAR